MFVCHTCFVFYTQPLFVYDQNPSIFLDINSERCVIQKRSPKKNSANNLTLEFEFPTILKAKDQAESSSITTTLRLRRTETGLTQFVQEWWPIIAGCAGGIILFGIVMYAAYRYGLHNKMRFTRAAAMAKDDTYEAL